MEELLNLKKKELLNKCIGYIGINRRLGYRNQNQKQQIKNMRRKLLKMRDSIGHMLKHPYSVHYKNRRGYSADKKQKKIDTQKSEVENMKCKINGIEVECTPQEFKQLMKEQEEEQPENSIEKPIKRRKLSKENGAIYREAVKLYKSGIAKNKLDALRRVLGGRQVGGSDYKQFEKHLKTTRVRFSKKDMLKYKEAARLLNEGKAKNKFVALKKVFPHHKGIGGLDYKRIEKYLKTPLKKQETKSEATSHNIDARRKRMKAIQSIAKSMYRLGGIKWGEALKRASFEYDNKFPKKPKNNKKVVTKGAVPKIIGDKTLNKLLIDIIGNIVANEGVMRQSSDGHILSIEDTEKWNILLLRILDNRKKLYDHFGVEGRFVIEGHKNARMLRYLKN